MKKISLVLMMNMFVAVMLAQTTNDTLNPGSVTLNKDPRIDVLGKKIAEYNEALVRFAHSGKGYRLMLLSTTDRNQAMQLRSQLLQQYPDQKVYMTFQSPYIKIKFGNFVEKAEAERIRKQLSGSSLIHGNIYLVAETIEIKGEKREEDE